MPQCTVRHQVVRECHYLTRPRFRFLLPVNIALAIASPCLNFLRSASAVQRNDLVVNPTEHDDPSHAKPVRVRVLDEYSLSSPVNLRRLS
jgi:hypothetical protein